MPDMSGQPTIEELQQQLRALAQERDQYRQAAQQPQQGFQPMPQQNGHVLGRVLGMDGDFSQVDQYYVPRTQYEQQLRAAEERAATRAYAMARGDLDVMFAIRDAQTQYKDLGDWNSALAKKTLEIMQKDNYASPRMMNGAPKQPSSWMDLVYERPDALSRAARVAQAELIHEQQAQQQSAQDAQAKQDAAAGVSGDGVITAPTQGTGKINSTEEAFAAIDRGDMRALDDSLKTG